jgi:hypothetical protein
MYLTILKCSESEAQAAENLIVLTTSLAPGRFTRLWGRVVEDLPVSLMA